MTHGADMKDRPWAERDLITVDLAAIRANVARLLSELGPGTGLLAVVKADAYGHGAIEVGRAAMQAGASGLAVATAREALELRDSGYAGSILVLGPLYEPEETARLAARSVDVAVVTENLPSLVRHLPETGPPLGLHVKIDTGMNRQGLRPDDLEAFLAAVSGNPRVVVNGVMTHFACADTDQACVAGQLEAFLPCVRAVKARWPGAAVHAANSAATLGQHEAHFDFVRCGIAVYGLSPYQDDPSPYGLQPALTWTSTVASVKDLGPGDSVGYGHSFTADRPTTLALVPVGYADGYRRHLSGRGEVLIGGRRYPVVGRVSMDSFTVDLGPGSPVQPGDRVTLLGRDGDERITAEQMAERIGTINYEITCGIETSRARRVYLNAEAPARSE